MTRLSLRFRIFLFFVLIAVVGILGFGIGLYLAHLRARGALPISASIQSGVVGSFILLAVVTFVWFMFDENVARPLVNLATDMRSRAHAGISSGIDARPARYLGDIAPAAEAVAANLRESRTEVDRIIEERSEQIALERRRFATLLQDAPVSLILCTRAHRIALYNSAAVAQFGNAEGDLGLHRSVFDLFAESELRVAVAQLEDGQADVSAQCDSRNGGTVTMRLSPIHSDDDDEFDGYLIAVSRGRDSASTQRAEIHSNGCYDFGLLSTCRDRLDPTSSLGELDYVVFDTETTGLEPHRGDEVVQIAGIRIVNGRMLQDEVFDTLVDPGRTIPAASTKVHCITEAMVAGAPQFGDAARRFHRFTRDGVLVAHNAPFDLSFFRKHEKRIGHRFNHPVLDTVLLSAIVFGADADHSLDALAERLDVTIPETLRHTALGDSIATAEVFLKLIPLLSSAGIQRLDDAISAENAIRDAVGMQALE